MKTTIHSGQLAACTHCNKNKCWGCGASFTLSTASLEETFCSQRCEDKNTVSGTLAPVPKVFKPRFNPQVARSRSDDRMNYTH